jgi:hypothetical protein
MRSFGFALGVLALALVGCSSDEEGKPEPPGPPTTDAQVLGEPHAGQYHLGPVDFASTEWHNACAPADSTYRSSLRDATGLGGEYLAGVANEYNQGGAVCDACILIKAGTGTSVVARVVTYGVEQDPNDIDVSQTVFDTLTTGEYPRAMTWEFAKCPDTGPLMYEFQTEANPFWTSLWVRNPRVPITKVEVESENHASFFEMRRAGDGTLNDDGGFGTGEFTLRVTGMDGQVVTETLPSFSAGELVTGSVQFE